MASIGAGSRDMAEHKPSWEWRSITDTAPIRVAPDRVPYTGQQLCLDEISELAELRRNADEVRVPTHPHIGPKTGDQLIALAHLELIARRQSTNTVSVPLSRSKPMFEGITDYRAITEHHRNGSAAHWNWDSNVHGDIDQAVLASSHDALGGLKATYSQNRAVALLAVFLAGTAILGWRHAADMGTRDGLAVIWIGLSALLVITQALAWADRPKKVTRERAQGLAALHVTVNVPVYNEDPEALKLVACALANQSRPPQRVEFVDDGSDRFDYTDVREELALLQLDHPETEFSWVRTERTATSGKRSAQAVTFRSDEDADVFATIDSDTILDPNAIKEGLKPFADPRVQSVAAVLLVYNAGRNLFTALTEIWLSVYQLGVRAAWSRLGCVLVNSGGLAFYRAPLVRDALPAYVGEKFGGRKVDYSDDAMLTFFAMLRGRTVQQPTCFAFTIMPENISHHVRQQLRWMRGSLIRLFWWFRYMSPLRTAWWLGFLAWATFAVVTILFFGIYGVVPLMHLEAPPLPSLPSLFLLSYIAALWSLTVKRSDQSTVRRLAAFGCSPLIAAWCMTVLCALRLWSLVTCMRSGWGTRSDVEVTLAESAP